MEAAVILGAGWEPLHYHVPADRTAGSLPDSQDLWDKLWASRGDLLGVAHSHPGGGIPGPSFTDVTTFAAIESGLGIRLFWPIVTTDAVRVFVWKGPGRLDYWAMGPESELEMTEPWIAELLRLSTPEGRH